METQIAIAQNKAIAGGLTPGDTAGFPITLTQPGRYVLTSNLYPPPNVHGIEIEAFDVTIDLNGFLLQGGGLARFGIIGKEVHTVSIQNGTIALFDGAGILGGNSWTVENMRISVNGDSGIRLGQFGRVKKYPYPQQL